HQDVHQAREARWLPGRTHAFPPGRVEGVTAREYADPRAAGCGGWHTDPHDLHRRQWRDVGGRHGGCEARTRWTRGRHATAVPGRLGPRRCAPTRPGSARTGARSDTQETKGNLEGEEAMSNRESYIPGAAADAEVRKDGDNWTLVLVRELRHSPEKVWQALTD